MYENKQIGRNFIDNPGMRRTARPQRYPLCPLCNASISSLSYQNKENDGGRNPRNKHSSCLPLSFRPYPLWMPRPSRRAAARSSMAPIPLILLAWRATNLEKCQFFGRLCVFECSEVFVSPSLPRSLCSRISTVSPARTLSSFGATPSKVYRTWAEGRAAWFARCSPSPDRRWAPSGVTPAGVF